MTTSMKNGWGAFRFPAVLTGDQTSASVLDSGQSAILGLLEAAIKTELDTAWRAVVQTLPDDNPLRSSEPVSAVESTLPLEPSTTTLQQIKKSFPVLCAYRMGEPTTEQITLHYEGHRQQWGVDWIVGPLDAGYQRKIGHFAHYVAVVIRMAIRIGSHPDYNGGHNPFYGKFAEIKTIGQQGPGVMTLLGSENSTGYWGVSMRLETLEREVFTHGGLEESAALSIHEFEQATTQVPYGTGDGTPYVDTVLTDFDHDDDIT